MSQPPSPYDRQYNFTDFQSANPTTPLPGQKVDQELNAVRSTLNATVSRLGEVQADDGKVRNSALNLQTIAEAVEPLLTTAPVQAINSAGATQVAAVNAAGTAQVANVNAAAASGVASINTAISNPMVTTVLVAEQQAVAAAASAQSDAANSLINRNLTYNLYVQTNSALSATQNAAMTAAADAASAANHSSSAGNSAGIAVSEASAANQAQLLAEAHMMAALDAKAQAEAAASTAQNIVNNGAAAIATEVQPYLDAAAQSATDAHNSANDALTSKTQAATSATNASNSASSAATSASNASSSASSAAASATAAANSAATINPANFAAAVHTHTIANVSGLQSALDAKIGDAPSNGNQYVRQNGSWSAIYTPPPTMYPADYMSGDQVSAVTTAMFKDWSQNATGGFSVGSGVLSFYDSSPTADTKSISFYDGSGFSHVDNGTSGWAITIPTSNGGSGGYYIEDLVSYLSSAGISLTASFSGMSMYDSLDQLTSYGTTLYKPNSFIQPGSRLMLEDGLEKYLISRAITAAASSNSVLTYANGAMSWNKPWQLEGYVTSGALSSYVLSSTYTSGLALKANIASPTFTGVVVTAASATGSAGFRLPHGAAPTTPTNGDLWSTTTGLFLRQNGATKQFVDFDSAQTISGNKTFSSASLTLGNSTATGTIAIGTGAVGSTVNKFVNIGTGGLTGSATSVVIGTSSGGTNSITINGSTTFSTGSKVTVTHNTTQAGLNVAPVATAPTTPASGDVWHDTSTGVNQIFGFANGIRGAMTAVRAFVNFNGTGVVAIRAGFNVSSITDNGVGDYTVNFGVAMPDANYSAIVSGKDATGTWTSLYGAAQTTSAVRVMCRGTGALTDTDTMTVAIFR